MKKKLKSIVMIACSVLLILVLGGTFYLTDNFRGKSSNAQLQLSRTIETSKSLIDYQNDLKMFDNAKLEHDGMLTTFEGYQTINLSDLDEFDEVSDLELYEEAKISIRYNFSYDYETNLVTLSVIMSENEQETIIDTIYGAAFVNESGDIDALLEIDEETILLSELQETEIIQECGWFKKALKKVKKAVKTVCKTTVGVVGAVATVVVPAAIGVAMAATGVGLVATIAVGAVAGAAIAGSTAAASTAQQNNGKVDWETVGLCVGVGAAVGALASGISYGVTNKVLSKTNTKTLKGDNKAINGDNVPKYPGDNATQSPGKGYEWRGNGDPSSGQGNWYNPKTGESLHPDLNHQEPYGPHWDYKSPSGNEYRIYPDGSFGLK